MSSLTLKLTFFFHLISICYLFLSQVASLQQELQEHSTNEIEQLRAENKLLSDTNQALLEEKKVAKYSSKLLLYTTTFVFF